MLRTTSLLVALVLLAGCGSDERKPASGDIFPTTGGSGGTPSDADTDAQGGAAGTELPEGGTEAGDEAGDDASDSSIDGPDPNIQCVVDPIPTTGQGYCVTVDEEAYLCNPVTSEPCNVGAGETCEFDGERFRCMPEEFLLVAPCELCGAPYPPLCISGFTCLGLGGKCTRYCCDSLQCALGEFCIMQPPTSVGICQAKSDQILAGFVGDPPPDAGPIDAGPPTYGAECNPPASPGDGSCIIVGSEFFDCNPVTNEGCNTAAKEACNKVGNKWSCVVGTRDDDICEPCTSTSCKAGFSCEPYLGCVKYCCTDTDCTPGQCHAYPGLGGLGLCLEPMDPDAG